MERISRGVGTPSRLFTRVVLCSSRMMSMHSSTHSSQMNTVGPAMSLRTSCWLLPQKEQYRVLFESPLAALVMVVSHSLGDPGWEPRYPPPRRASAHPCRLRAVGCLSLDIPRSEPGSQALERRSGVWRRVAQGPCADFYMG